MRLYNLISSLVLHIMFIFFFMILQLSGTSRAQGYLRLHGHMYNNKCDQEAGNYTNTSAYKTNLHHVLSDLVSKASDTKFYNTSHGAGNDQVFGNFYCRFDINPLDCQGCIQDAAREIVQTCSVEKTAVIWYDVCTLRFASHSMLYSKFENVSASVCYFSNVTNPVKFLGAIKDGMNQLIDKAAHNKSNEGVAFGVKKVSDFQKVHCFVQCRPDTTGEDCYRCLTRSLEILEFKCKGEKEGGLNMAVNCHMRYENFPFLKLRYLEPPLSSSYGPPPLGLPAPPTPAPSGLIQSSGKNTANYITRGVMAVAAIGQVLLLDFP